jgi:hypothetical protein
MMNRDCMVCLLLHDVLWRQLHLLLTEFVSYPAARVLPK